MNIKNSFSEIGAAVMLMLTSFCVLASTAEVLLGEMKLPPVPAKLQSTTQVLSKIETPVIKNSQGLVARGLHNVYVTVDASAAYPLVVQGQTIKPGETKTIAVNLSNSGGRLSIPIYPAVGKVAGLANYTAEIKDIVVAVCPEFFTEAAADCFRIVMQPTQAVCSNGFTATNNTCNREQIITKQVNCNTGYINNNGVCTQAVIVNSVKKCSAGYALTQSGDCEQVKWLQLQQCQFGMTYTGTACTKTIQALAENGSCPEGGTLNTTNPMYCDLVITEAAGQWCEGVNVINGEACSDSGSTKTCRSYNLTYGSCEKRITTAAVNGCPDGSTDLGAGQCVQDHSYSLNNSCEAGYTLTSGSICTKVEVIASTPYCDTDYTLSGSSCTKSLSQSVSSPCEVGFTLNGNQCQKTDSVVANPTCPSSSYWDGTTCRGFAEPVSWDCTNQTYPGKAFWYPPRCYYEYPASGNSCGTDDYRSGTCYVYVQGTNVTCPAGYAYDNQRHCIKTVNPTSYSCPDASWTLEGSSCTKTTYATPAYKCETGYVWNGTIGKCEKSQMTPAISGCPAGYEQNGATCSGLQQGPIMWHCYNEDYPSQWGQDSGMCAAYLPIVNQADCGAKPFVQENEHPDPRVTGYCIELIKGENFSCNSGYTWNSTKFACVSSSTTQQIYSCPDATWTLSGQSCTKTDYKDRYTTCPPSWTLSGSTCYYTETKAANKQCGTGYTLQADNTCTKTISAIATANCPLGYIDNGTSCASTISIPAIVKCDAPYLFDAITKMCKFEIRVPKFN